MAVDKEGYYNINEIKIDNIQEDKANIKTTYSIEEQEVGTWIDGKKLHQKTFNIYASRRDVKPSTYTSYADISTDGTIVVYYGSTVYTTKTIVTAKYTKK